MAQQEVVVVALGRAGTHQIERLRPLAQHRELRAHAAGRGQRVGELDAAFGLRQPVGEHAVERGLRPRPRHPELGEAGDVDEPGTLAHRPAFGAHGLEVVGAAEAPLVAPLRALRREPVGPLPAVALAPDRAVGREPLVAGAGLRRARRRALLVRVMDDEDVGVGLLVLDRGVVLVGIGTEAAGVDRQHVDGGLAVCDPARELPAGAARSGDAEAEALGQPEVGEAIGRADEGVAVRRVGDRAVDAVLDPSAAEHRHPVDRGLDMGLQAVHIRRQQLLAKALRHAVHRPGRRILLVGPEDQALALFAHVVGGIALPEHRHLRQALGLALFKLRNGVGHEILVLHRDRRQVEADHRAHLPGPGARRGHHRLAGDVAPCRLHQPLAGGGALDPRDLGVAVDLRPPIARALRQRLGHIHRRDVAVVGMEEGAHQAVEVAERPERADLVGADQLEGDADGVRRAAIVAVLVHPLPVGGEAEVAGAVEAHRLPGLRLELLVEVDRVLVQLADAVAHVEERQQAGGVPGGACGELGLLDQHDVGPAELRQMVEHAAADDAAADHHHPRPIPHASAFPALSARLTAREPYHARAAFGRSAAGRPAHRLTLPANAAKTARRRGRSPPASAT